MLIATTNFAGTQPLADEYPHFFQVERYLQGQYAPIPEMTAIPGLHAFVAGIEWIFHSNSLGVARAITTVFAFAAILAFAGIRRDLAPTDDASLATLQFFFFPLLFPFCFLFYTDVPSLALVLWALRCALSGRHRIASLLGLASLLVRQNNVVWIAFIALLQLLELRKLHPSSGVCRRAAIKLWPYAVPAVVFALFWLWNGSIAMSRLEAKMHPDIALHAGNLYFMLFLAALFLLPLMPLWLLRYLKEVRTRPALLLIPLLLGALYAATFVVDNPYNLISQDYFLRNFLLRIVVENSGAHVAFGIIAVAAACALTQVPWQRASFMLLLPTAALFVSFSWLIEQRYYLIPFALLLALRRSEDRWRERTLLALWVPAAVGLFYGIATLKFFL